MAITRVKKQSSWRIKINIYVNNGDIQNQFLTTFFVFRFYDVVWPIYFYSTHSCLISNVDETRPSTRPLWLFWYRFMSSFEHLCAQILKVSPSAMEVIFDCIMSSFEHLCTQILKVSPSAMEVIFDSIMSNLVHLCTQIHQGRAFGDGSDNWLYNVEFRALMHSNSSRSCLQQNK